MYQESGLIPGSCHILPPEGSHHSSAYSTIKSMRSLKGNLATDFSFILQEELHAYYKKKNPKNCLCIKGLKTYLLAHGIQCCLVCRESSLFTAPLWGHWNPFLVHVGSWKDHVWRDVALHQCGCTLWRDPDMGLHIWSYCDHEVTMPLCDFTADSCHHVKGSGKITDLEANQQEETHITMKKKKKKNCVNVSDCLHYM